MKAEVRFQSFKCRKAIVKSSTWGAHREALKAARARLPSRNKSMGRPTCHYPSSEYLYDGATAYQCSPAVLDNSIFLYYCVYVHFTVTTQQPITPVM